MNNLSFFVQNKLSKYFLLCGPKVFISWSMGFIFWATAYIVIIFNLKKHKKLEIPSLVIPLNLSWEFVWTTELTSPLGNLHRTASLIWLFLDILIIYYIITKNKVLTNLNIFKINIFINLTLFLTGAILTYYMNTLYNDELGFFSSYPLNLLISCLFISNIIINKNTIPSLSVAWTKWLGTSSISFGGYFYYDKSIVLLVMFFIIIFILDISYILLIYQRKSTLSRCTEHLVISTCRQVYSENT